MSAEQIDAEKLEEAINRVERSWRWTAVEDDERKFLILSAARAHLSTLPRVKEVEVWRVEYSVNGVPSILQWRTRDAADAWIRGASPLPYIECVSVTGPHKQKVPA